MNSSIYLGEHIDYALFGCFPAAIERDILIACGPRTEPHHTQGSVIAENLYPKYTRQVFHPVRKLSVSGTDDIPECAVHVEEWHMDIDTKQLKWESYVKAGYYVSFLVHAVFAFADQTYIGCSESLLRF